MNGPGDIPISSNGTAAIRPCGLTSLIPTLGMSCRGRAEAFARRLQSKLRTLGSQNGDSPTNEEDPILNGTGNTWITHNDQNNQVVVTAIQPSLRHSSQDTADSFFDFDCEIDEIESPGSPVDECEYSRLIETTSNTPHDCAIESGCICSSPVTPTNGSRASSQSSDGPYFDPVSSDSGEPQSQTQQQRSKTTTIPIINRTSTIAQQQDTLSRTPTDFYDCLETNKVTANNMTNMELERKNVILTNGHNNHYNHHSTNNDHHLQQSHDEVDHQHPVHDVQQHTNEHILHMNGGDHHNHHHHHHLQKYNMENHDSSCDSLSDSLPPSQDSSTTVTTTPTTPSSSMNSGLANGITDYSSIPLSLNTESFNIMQDFVLNKLQMISYEMKLNGTELNDDQHHQTDCKNSTEIILENGHNHNDDLDEPPLSPIENTNINFGNTDNNEQLQKLKTQIDAAVDAVIASAAQHHDDESLNSITNDEQMLIANKRNLDKDNEDDNHDNNKQQHLCDTDEEDDCRPQRVRRCSSLKTGKTPPGTPGRKKIVRFADVLGLDLADVKTFLDEIPNVPISAYQDLEVVEAEPPVQLGPKADRILMPLFQQPGGLPSFLDIVRVKQVNLENATITDHLNLTINGSVRVRNLDFHKSVHIRYTTDTWRTFTDISTTYVPNSCDGFSDKFIFTLCCNRLMVGQRLEFAVRFQCKGQQFWDNNYGSNYCFQCLPATTTPTSSTLIQSSNNLSFNNHIRPLNTQQSTNSQHNQHQQHNLHHHHHHQHQHHTNNHHMLSPSAVNNDAWCVSFY